MIIIRKIIRRLLLECQKIRIIKFKLLSSVNIRIKGKPCLIQPLLMVGNGEIKFSQNVKIGFFPSPYFFNGYAHFDLRGLEASIELGKDVWLNNNAVLIADNASIIIGEKSIAGTNLTIYTSNFHHLDPENRMKPGYESMNVIIGENVFIGSNVTILKGVTIGDNSVIGSGSLLNKSIPSNVIAAGVPCNVISNL